jgi:hypothetical protein
VIQDVGDVALRPPGAIRENQSDEDKKQAGEAD